MPVLIRMHEKNRLLFCESFGIFSHPTYYVIIRARRLMNYKILNNYLKKCKYDL